MVSVLVFVVGDVRPFAFPCRSLRFAPMATGQVFCADFLVAIRALVNVHHSLYRNLPPQGLYFEALVEETFRQIKKPFTVIQAGGRNQPGHDLLVEGVRLSLKTETGYSTDPEQITITKLCTTEREPWSPATLIDRVLAHLSRYDAILMLRAVWSKPLIRYQLVEIPIDLLRLVKTAQPTPRRAAQRPPEPWRRCVS
jgi:hypothetical protein